MIPEAFLICALALPSQMQTTGHDHLMTRDDAKVFNTLLEPIRNHDHKQPAILFANNYYDVAEQLRRYGLKAYSMTIVLTGGHLRGEVMNMPFAPGSLGAVVILQKLVYAELFEAIDPVAVAGVFMIEEKNMPYLADVIMTGLGFRRSGMQWHSFSIYRRMFAAEYKAGTGFDVFNAKKVQKPYLVHRSILGAA